MDGVLLCSWAVLTLRIADRDAVSKRDRECLLVDEMMASQASAKQSLSDPHFGHSEHPIAAPGISH